MTFEVDNEALKAAMMRHYEEKLAKELREMFIFGGNEDTNRIWQLYMEEIRQREEARKENVRDFWQSFVMITSLAMTGYAAYRLWTL
jgi:hypothetical protein